MPKDEIEELSRDQLILILKFMRGIFGDRQIADLVHILLNPSYICDSPRNLTGDRNA